MARMTFHDLTSLLVVLASLSQAMADDSKCYSRALGNVISGDWLPCSNTALSVGGAQACCMAGSQCGEDSLCHTPATLSTGNTTWYPSGCTDPTYQDPVCRLSCTTNLYTFAIYNTTSDLWACCGESGCNGTTTGETFSAIAPNKWTAVPTTATNTYNVAATVSVPKPTTTSSRPHTTSSTVPTTTSSPAAVVTVTSTPTPRNHEGLSTGAQAGIGVGVGIVGVAVIAAAVFFFLRRRRSAKHDRAGLPGYDDAMAGHAAAKYANVETSELPANGFRNELEARNIPQELPSEPWKNKKA